MTPILTVDVVLLTLVKDSLHVALFNRERAPFEGGLALPGGFIHADEDKNAVAAAARVLKQKTGLVSPYLEELCTFSGPFRDPRGWSVTLAYYALVPADLLDTGVRLFPVSAMPALPFDHEEIVETAVARVRNKSGYSSLPAHLCETEFTVAELHAAYQALLGEDISMTSFRRKLDELKVLEAVKGKMRLTGSSRPAQLYRQRKEFTHRLSLSNRSL